MAYIYNATNEEQSVKAFGNHFSFKPGQIKWLHNDDIALFINMNRKDSNGLAMLPPEFSPETPEFKDSEAGKVLLDQIKQEAINAYIRFHEAIIRNNQVSLRRDYDLANIKADVSTEVSEGELKSMEIVANYRKTTQTTTAQAKKDKVAELMKQIGSTK